MANWKKVIVSGSSAELNDIFALGNITGSNISSSGELYFNSSEGNYTDLVVVDTSTGKLYRTASSAIQSDTTDIEADITQLQASASAGIRFEDSDSGFSTSLIGTASFSASGPGLSVNVASDTIEYIVNPDTLVDGTTDSSTFYFTASRAISASNADSASTVTVIDNDFTNVAYPVVFHEGSAGDSVTLQSDATTFKYNPGLATLLIGKSSEIVLISTASFSVTGISDYNFGGGINGTITIADSATTTNLGSATAGATLNVKNENINLGDAEGDSVTVAGTLDVNGGDISTDDTSFDLLNTTATTINFGGAATNITMGTSNGTVNIAGSASIAGDLIVQGTTTTLNTENLLVEDRYILLGSASSANTVGGGIIVQRSAQNVGTALHWDEAQNVWALDVANANASTGTAKALDANIAFVSHSAGLPGASYDAAVIVGEDENYKKGQFYVDTSDDYGLYVYL